MSEKIAVKGIREKKDRLDDLKYDALIIDDDSLHAGLLARRLSRRGLKASVYDDGEKALEDTINFRPRALFSDLQMPVMSGIEIASRARKLGFSGLLILVTASREKSLLEDAIASGVDIILDKPPRDYDLDWLAARIRIGARVSADVDAMTKVIECMDQGAILLDEESLPLCMNRQAKSLLGIDDSSDLVSTLDGLGIGKLLGSTQQRNIVFTESCPSSGARKIPIGIEVRELCIGDRRLHVLLLHDFSEHCRMEDHQTQLAAYLSHRVRTPLTSVRNAISILRGSGAQLENAEKERLFDIAERNIDKLVTSIDEAQRNFMAGLGVASGCRALVDVGKALESVFAEAESAGKIAGFKIRSQRGLAILSRPRLCEFVKSVISLMADRIESAPHIDCTVSLREGLIELGIDDPQISILLSSHSSCSVSSIPLEIYTRREKGESYRALEGLAVSLNGEISFPDNQSIRLVLPVECAYDQEWDLAQPLYLMLERAKLMKAALFLLSVRSVGGIGDNRTFKKKFVETLVDLFSGENDLVTQGSSQCEHFIFCVGLSLDELKSRMDSLRSSLSRWAVEKGEELHPALRWHIAYQFDPGSSGSSEEYPSLELVVN